MDDAEKIEKITEGYVRILLENQLENTASYIKLSVRLANINDMEVAKLIGRENDLSRMTGCGARAN